MAIYYSGENAIFKVEERDPKQRDTRDIVVVFQDPGMDVYDMHISIESSKFPNRVNEYIENGTVEEMAALLNKHRKNYPIVEEAAVKFGQHLKSS